MKAILLLLLLFALCSPIVGQKLPKWHRVHSFEESAIDMDTTNVVLGGEIGRVIFRWSFNQPQTSKDDPRLKYSSKLETIEFKCADHLYRTFRISFLDGAGNALRSELMRPPYEWRPIRSSSMMAKISMPACELIGRASGPSVKSARTSDEEAKSGAALQIAVSFIKTLQQTRDFRPAIKKYFASDYLRRYQQDHQRKWFFNLNPDLVVQAKPAELEKYYLASLNAGYLSLLYIVSQSSSRPSAAGEKMIPLDVKETIENHPYSAAYHNERKSYKYLAERIDSLERMRNYTDLLEKVAVLMRKHVVAVDAERSKLWQRIESDGELYRAKISTCPQGCLGLPKETKVFQIKVPILLLQIAEVNGKLKIISASDRQSN
jgi:surface-adhesin protein E